MALKDIINTFCLIHTKTKSIVFFIKSHSSNYLSKKLDCQNCLYTISPNTARPALTHLAPHRFQRKLAADGWGVAGVFPKGRRRLLKPQHKSGHGEWRKYRIGSKASSSVSILMRSPSTISLDESSSLWRDGTFATLESPRSATLRESCRPSRSSSDEDVAVLKGMAIYRNV